MNTNVKRISLRTSLLVIVIAVLLFGGIGITGAAAQSSIPGDALYPVKTSIEQTRLSLARDAGDRAVMKINFAEQRLEEVKSLISEGRYSEVRGAVLSFEANINGAILEAQTVAKVDPTRAAGLAADIIAALTRYAQVLTDLAAIAPDSIKGEVNRALDTTQVASGLDMPTDNSNDNANDDNGNDNANDDNGNDNANDDNGNDNADDDNGNDNADDDNGNDNADDDSGNDNADDDNGNDNADDDNGNDNADDDSGNDNADDDSGNDNADDDSGNDNADDDSGNDNADDDSGNDNGNDDSDDDDSSKGKGG